MDMDWLESMCHQDGEFLGEYMAQQSSIVAAGAAAATEINASPPELLPITSILSSNNSMATILGKSKPPCYPKKRTSSNLNFESKANGTGLAKEEKIIRSKSKTLFHTLAERRRRLELAHKFTELSAIIPRSKKTDKASIVQGAINYVEKLQKRVMELEVQQNKRGKEPIILLNKENSCEMNLDNYLRPINNFLPDVKVKVLENNILIYINCEKENGIQHKILDMLQNLHLFVTSTSILPFGNSTLGITIIAQMGDAYRMTMMDLVDNIRKLLVNGANRRT
ncbi:helix loop helix DNA-binding domain protein [Medicago truncatula]|uniref:Helix loop helix DNA-binding domain protein n=2 Tax=Medicago truncatula TaxID=3880 RepID=G7IMB1_MEDTR|nr:helix loop helix DNA-binding domain protein [Medicago truncatula]